MEEKSYRVAVAATTSFDLELRTTMSFRRWQSRASNDDEQVVVTTSFKHDGGAMGQGLVLGFTSDTFSFFLGMGWA